MPEAKRPEAGEEHLPAKRAGAVVRAPARVAVALVFVSLGAAAFAIAFRGGLQLVYGYLYGHPDVLDAFVNLPYAARVLVPAAGGLLAGSVARISARFRGPGMGDVMEAVVLGRTRLSFRGTMSRALGSWLALATGNSVGREGALIQFGGTIGSSIASLSAIRGANARALIAAGTAAGFSAAYNTPFAAVLFVIEVVTGVVAIEAIAMVMIATAIATALLRATVGGGPIYGQRAFAVMSPTELFAHALLGVLAGLVAQAFMRLLAAGEGAFQRTKIPQPWRAGLGGALVGLLAAPLPEVVGNGFEPLNVLLDGRYAVSLVVVLVVAKAFATTASVASGSPGGVFTPSLFIGGGVGMLWGHAVAAFVEAPSPQGSYILVGMAAMIAATTHAPLMASVLVFEVSGDYGIVLPLVLATAFATLVSFLMRRDSIYTAELRRRGIHWEMTLGGRRVRRSRGDGGST